MKKRVGSVCPIVYALDLWGDPWSLVVLRDVLIHDKQHYREFLASREGIATNVLSARLASLTDAGLLTRSEGTNRAETKYRPTRKALELLPVLFSIMRWGLAHNPHTDMSIPIMRELLCDEPGLAKRLLARFDVPSAAKPKPKRATRRSP